MRLSLINRGSSATAGIRANTLPSEIVADPRNMFLNKTRQDKSWNFKITFERQGWIVREA